MRNALTKMDINLPELQEALERGDRALLLTPISEAFAEYNPNAANAATKAVSITTGASHRSKMNNGQSQQNSESNESSRNDNSSSG